MQCIKCGADYEDGAKFCPKCGEKSGVKCASCGQINLFNAAFCRSCGKKIEQMCPQCGAELIAGQNFCAKCGYSVVNISGSGTSDKMPIIQRVAQSFNTADKSKKKLTFSEPLRYSAAGLAALIIIIVVAAGGNAPKPERDDAGALAYENPALQTALIQADLLAQNKKYGQAEKAFLDIISGYEDTAYAYSGLATLYIEQGDVKKAAELVERGLDDHPYDPALAAYSQLLSMEGKVQEAGERLTELAEREDTDKGSDVGIDIKTKWSPETGSYNLVGTSSTRLGEDIQIVNGEVYIANAKGWDAGGLYKVNGSTGALEEVVQDIKITYYNQSGEWIYFASFESVSRMKLDGSELTCLYELPDSVSSTGIGEMYADESHIYFASQYFDDTQEQYLYQLYRMDHNGEDLTLLGGGCGVTNVFFTTEHIYFRLKNPLLDGVYTRMNYDGAGIEYKELFGEIPEYGTDDSYFDRIGFRELAASFYNQNHIISIHEDGNYNMVTQYIQEVSRASNVPFMPLGDKIYVGAGASICVIPMDGVLTKEQFDKYNEQNLSNEERYGNISYRYLDSETGQFKVFTYSGVDPGSEYVYAYECDYDPVLNEFSEIAGYEIPLTEYSKSSFGANMYPVSVDTAINDYLYYTKPLGYSLDMQAMTSNFEYGYYRMPTDSGEEYVLYDPQKDGITLFMEDPLVYARDENGFMTGERVFADWYLQSMEEASDE